MSTCIFFTILIAHLFSTKIVAQRYQIDEEKLKYIEYYNNFRKELFEENRLNISKNNFRQLRFSAMLFMFLKERQSLVNGSGYFLSGEKNELKKITNEKTDNEILLIAQSIFQEDVTYLPALQVLISSNAVDKKFQKNVIKLYKGLENSLLKSGDGKSIKSAYEVFGAGETEYLLGNKCGNGSISEHIKKNGRVYSHIRCGGKKEDDFIIYMDVTAKATFEFAPRYTSFANTFRKREKLVDNLVKRSSMREKATRSIVSSETKAIADTMANTFIRLYRERQWEALWEHFKEKSQYYNPVEGSEKERFFAKMRAIYNNCGHFQGAELAETNQFKFGMSMSRALEYQYNAKYDKCDKKIFLEIWTVEDSIENFMHFGFERRKDE